MQERRGFWDILETSIALSLATSGDMSWGADRNTLILMFQASGLDVTAGDLERELRNVDDTFPWRVEISGDRYNFVSRA